MAERHFSTEEQHGISSSLFLIIPVLFPILDLAGDEDPLAIPIMYASAISGDIALAYIIVLFDLERHR